MVSFALPPEITSRLVHILLDHWASKRAGRLAPRWREIDPGDIKPALPFLCVADVKESPFDLRFRLAGTALVEAAGYDFMGCNLRAMKLLNGDVEGWLRYYRQIVDQKRPSFGHYQGIVKSDVVYVADCAMLPLSDDGQTVNRIIQVEDWSAIHGANLKRLPNIVWRFAPL
jgi:hypothetical protein